MSDLDAVNRKPAGAKGAAPEWPTPPVSVSRGTEREERRISNGDCAAAAATAEISPGAMMEHRARPERARPSIGAAPLMLPGGATVAAVVGCIAPSSQDAGVTVLDPVAPSRPLPLFDSAGVAERTLAEDVGPGSGDEGTTNGALIRSWIAPGGRGASTGQDDPVLPGAGGLPGGGSDRLPVEGEAAERPAVEPDGAARSGGGTDPVTLVGEESPTSVVAGESTRGERAERPAVISMAVSRAAPCAAPPRDHPDAPVVGEETLGANGPEVASVEPGGQGSATRVLLSEPGTLSPNTPQFGSESASHEGDADGASVSRETATGADGDERCGDTGPGDLAETSVGRGAPTLVHPEAGGWVHQERCREEGRVSFTATAQPSAATGNRLPSGRPPESGSPESGSPECRARSQEACDSGVAGADENAAGRHQGTAQRRSGASNHALRRNTYPGGAIPAPDQPLSRVPSPGEESWEPLTGPPPWLETITGHTSPSGAQAPSDDDGSAAMHKVTTGSGSASTTTWDSPNVGSPPERVEPSASTWQPPGMAPYLDESERVNLVESLPLVDESTPLAFQVAEDARRRISLVGRPFPAPPRTRVLTVANQKGGVGKTTTAVNIAAALAQAGLQVLVLDIDPQGNASTALGIDHHADVPSLYDVVVEGRPLEDVVQACPDVPNLWCAPATIDLAGAEIELVSLVARETRLQKALHSYLAERDQRGEPQIDYVFIDCPPSLSLLTVNAFVAAEEVFIPIQCEYYALEGLSQLLKHVELIRGHLNTELHVSTILLTMYDGRTRLSAQVAEEVRTHFPHQVVKTTVPRSVRISEAPSHGQTVMTYDPASSGALSYLEAARELAEQVLGWRRGTRQEEQA